MSEAQPWGGKAMLSTASVAGRASNWAFVASSPSFTRVKVMSTGASGDDSNTRCWTVTSAAATTATAAKHRAAIAHEGGAGPLHLRLEAMSMARGAGMGHCEGGGGQDPRRAPNDGNRSLYRRISTMPLVPFKLVTLPGCYCIESHDPTNPAAVSPVCGVFGVDGAAGAGRGGVGRPHLTAAVCCCPPMVVAGLAGHQSGHPLQRWNHPDARKCRRDETSSRGGPAQGHRRGGRGVQAIVRTVPLRRHGLHPRGPRPWRCLLLP